MLIYVSAAPLTVDHDGGRGVIPAGEVIDPAIIETWPARGLNALVEVEKVKVYDTDEYDRIIAEFDERFGTAKAPRKRRTLQAA